MRFTFISLTVTTILGIPASAAAQPAPSFANQVRPFLAKYCLECHSADKTKGGLNLESFKELMKGGDDGPAVVTGKPEESRLVRLVEGKDKPKMPPQKAKQPKPEEYAVLRAWIAAGAKDDSGNIKVVIPDVRPRGPVTVPVAALAYHPDGKRLAAGGSKEVFIIDVTGGDVIGKLTRQAGQVTALAFSRDGKTLAVSGGAAATTGDVRLYDMPPTGAPADKPAHILPGHKDVVYVLAWSPDNKTLASTGYDRLIKLWDVTTGKEIRTLKDHSDTVYGLTFNHDGTLLASAAADRAVKVWDAANGNRLYTLGESTDWLYALAWSPDGRHLAAAGVDKSIRIWEASAAGGKIVHSVFAHEAAALRLAYDADGKTLYSIGEDRVLKAWDTALMVERKVYAPQPETVLSLAVRPDHKQVALGRYDGALVLLDEATGQVQSQPLPAKPKPPQLNKLAPASGQRGISVRVRLEGSQLDGVSQINVNHAGGAAKIVLEGRSATALHADLLFPASTPAGAYQVSVKNAVGESAAQTFFVDRYASVPEQEPNDTPGTGQKLTLPVSVAGAVDKAGAVDYFRFEATVGQQIGVQAVTAGSKLEAVLTLLDGSGKVLAETSNGVLGHVCDKGGSFILGIRDRDYRGGADMTYRLQVGDIPVVTSLFPLGVQRGAEAEVRVEGVHLGNVKSVRVKVPADAAIGSTMPLAIATTQGPPLGNPNVVVGEFPEVIGGGAVLALAVPGTGNGVIAKPQAADVWRFSAKKGQTLIVEVNARRLGSPLDSFIEILDAKNQPVPRATLRCVAQTFSVFRDHDSANTGIRIEAWSDLVVNDYLLVGSELLRIRALPKNPDDDCQFFSAAGQRVGQLDTTPTHHSLGTPMYKVAIHPPGSTFPPNGLPVVTIFNRNDDGGPGYGKDSRLFFEPPADGDYQVRIGDARGQAGSNFAYRLTVRPPRPSFDIRFSPTSPSVWKGGAVSVAVTATRTDGFQGPIAIRLDNLPPGFSAPPTSIPEDEESTSFALWADATATNPTGGTAPKLSARAVINGATVTREATGQLPKVLEPGDIVTTTEQSEVTLEPGKEVRLKVTIERRNGFMGRVPLEVRGLPHGVRVLDIGLNGILIIPTETSRTVVIHAEPWVKPTEHPFVVLARREGKNTEHAAKSVLLKVKGK